MGPKWPKFKVFGHFLNFESLDLSDLPGAGGYCTKKNYWVQIGPILDLSPNYFCLQIHFLDIASSDYANFACDDRQAWYLTGDGGLNGRKNIYWPWDLVSSRNDGVNMRKTALYQVISSFGFMKWLVIAKYCSSNLSERCPSRIRHILQILHTFL